MQIKLKHIISLVFSLIIVFLVQYKPISSDKDRDDLAKTWANTKMAGMTLEKKVGQLFMIQAYSNQGETHQKNLLEAVNRYHIGGIAFFQGSPGKQVELTRKLQYASEIPLLVALDAEWGLGMRLDSAISFPRQFTLGAIQDNRLIYEMGKEIGSQLKEIGVHMNFAPVIDINNNPRNPIINDRSFGEGKKNVSRKGYAYMRGMQEKGILACAKHFPGHGDTDKDSHKILPTISKTREELEEMELFPFKLLFQQGVKSVMVGHLHVPSIDNRKNRPASLSDKLIQGLIREEMGFNGLILTDALGMKGVADHFKAGEIEVEAFLAGNDILTVSQSLPAAYKAVLKAVRTGKISQQRLESSVLRILVSKFEAGLFFPPDLKVKKLDKALNSGKALALKENLFRNSVTYLKGKTGALPITKANNKKIATIAVGINEEGVFQDRISSYSDAKHYFLPKNANANDVNRLNRELSEAEIVIFSFEALNKSRRKKFGISQHALSLFKQVQTKSKVYAVIFGSPYCLELFNPNDNIILAYEEDPMAKDMAAQAIFGANEIEGKLPVTVGYGFSQGSGDFVAKSKVLSYALPEHVGLSSDSLAQIAQIVETMINTGAAPGCQVIVAKNSRIIYDRTFGFHTYDKKRSVQQDDIYDLASVTKIMATTLAVMKLYENGQIDIFDKVSRYIEGDIDTSNKKDITIIEALTHHAGLKPWIPFYQGTLDTLKDNSIVPSNRFYRRIASSGFDVKVANDLFIDRTYKDTIQKLIYGSELRKNKKYKYSDLGLYLVKDVVEEVTGKTLDQYVFEQYYKPLDLPHIGFNPSNRVNLDRIVPTEDDNYYRMQKLQGYVHDMGAAMLGGVSGHAGLFSNASDLVVLMQMLINNGVYGDQRYLDQKTIYTFTTRYQRSSRRGIGFDMKELNNRKSMNMSDLAPPSTFGHLGFTGTCVFADPDNDLIYVFLSNRTYPTMQNKKFVKESYRSKIHSVIYQSLID